MSSDNVKKRNKIELANLFSLLEVHLKKNIYFFKRNKVELNFFGESSNIPKNIKKLLSTSKNKTKLKKKKLTLSIAFNYSSRQEIVNSCKQIISNHKPINQKNISKYLYTNSIPDPEVLIRTGGYSRLSDFLLWQCSYTEIFFIKKFWPDFKSKDLDIVVKKFNKLKRNFGS